jgi:hypothetical protein
MDSTNDVGIMSESLAGLDDTQGRGMSYIVAPLGCILHCCFMNGMNGFLFFTHVLELS